MAIKIIIFLLLTGLSYSQVSHYSSLVKKRVAAGETYNTDSLKQSYIYTSLTDGTVLNDEWDDEQAGTNALALTGTNATKADSGVVFAGGGAYYDANTFVFDSSFTIEMVVKIVDTTSSQGLANCRTAGGRQLMARISAGGDLIVSARVGTTYYDIKATNLSLIYGQVAHIVVTWVGRPSVPVIYFNNVDVSEASTSDISLDDGDWIQFGEVDSYPSANTVLKYFAFFTDDFDATRVGVHYNSSKIQALLP